MKVLFIPTLFLFIFFCSAGKAQTKLETVLNNYFHRVTSTKNIQYSINRIDTFAQGGTIWNNKGHAIIEKDNKDSLFGFRFLASRFDMPDVFMYDGQYEFDIDETNKSYTKAKAGKGFLGSPGGQMIVKEIFKLDSLYEKIDLVDSNENYKVRYDFADDTTYNVVKSFKIVEIDKKSYLPIKITTSYVQLGGKAVHQIILSNIVTNSNGTSRTDQKRVELTGYQQIVDSIEDRSLLLLNKPFPQISLFNLQNNKDQHQIKKGKLTLLDFWEVWCAPCIKSLPEVQKLNDKYAGQINVIGIVSEDFVNARKLVLKAKVKFKNLIGDQNTLKDYEVNSFPRYILIDKNGIVQRRYFGFNTEQIQKDIAEFLIK
jgi:thiol-disulfide isomerase/thioredoxin